MTDSIVQMEFKDPPRAEHEISFKVVTAGPDEWQAVYTSMSRMAAQWGPYHKKVSVSSILLDDDIVAAFPGEYCDDVTVMKVHRILVSAGLHPDEADRVMQEMEKAGILFREHI